MTDLDETNEGPFELQFFAAGEFRFVRAVCDRLIPEDDLGPGAVSLGVPEFIDRHMLTPYAGGALWYREGPYFAAPEEFGYQGPLAPREILRQGILATDAFCEDKFGRPFSILEHEQQDEVLRALELDQIAIDGVSAGRFFAMLLGEVRAGFFSDPVHGGNRGMAGWKLIGYPGRPNDYRHAVTLRDAPYSGKIRSIAQEPKR